MWGRKIISELPRILWSSVLNCFLSSHSPILQEIQNKHQITPFVRQYPLLLQEVWGGVAMHTGRRNKIHQSSSQSQSSVYQASNQQSLLTEKQRVTPILNFKGDQGSPTKKTQHLKGFCWASSHICKCGLPTELILPGGSETLPIPAQQFHRAQHHSSHSAPDITPPKRQRQLERKNKPFNQHNPERFKASSCSTIHLSGARALRRKQQSGSLWQSQKVSSGKGCLHSWPCSSQSSIKGIFHFSLQVTFILNPSLQPPLNKHHHNSSILDHSAPSRFLVWASRPPAFRCWSPIYNAIYHQICSPLQY